MDSGGNKVDKTARLHFECSRGIVAVKRLPYLGGAKNGMGREKHFFPLSHLSGSPPFFVELELVNNS